MLDLSIKKLHHFHQSTLIGENGVNTNNSIMFLTLSPCINCAKLLVAAGIKEVYFNEKYDRDITGIDFLIKNNIKVYDINE